MKNTDLYIFHDVPAKKYVPTNCVYFFATYAAKSEIRVFPNSTTNFRCFAILADEYDDDLATILPNISFI